MADYPNMYADLPAGSGLNAILRDEEHYRGCMERNQEKLLFGSDCNDVLGRGPGCQGVQILAGIRPRRADERNSVEDSVWQCEAAFAPHVGKKAVSK